MFTVRYVESDGHETIIQSNRVTAVPSQNVGGKGHRVSDGFASQVFYDQPDGSTFLVDTGSVYVMNDLGKTVAVYHLDKGQVPKSTKGQSP